MCSLYSQHPFSTVNLRSIGRLLKMTTDRDQAGDCPDDMESVEEEETNQEIATNQILAFPNVLAAIQSQNHQDWLANLPATVKRRIKALKKIQFEHTGLEAQFFKEVHDLECKYHNLSIPLYEKRSQIANGDYEPNDAECEWPSDEESEDELPKALKEKAKLTEADQENKEQSKQDKDIKGIPDFWLTVFRNCTVLSEMVQPHDVPILKQLKDVKLITVPEPMSFTLEFHFAPNEYFTNTVLIKKYDLKCVPDEDEPFNFEGPEIFMCTGCTINWNKGKNITVKTVKKKQKHKNRGVVRTVTKTVQNDSFFNFFTPPAIPDTTKGEDLDEDLRNLITADFEIGHYLRERVIPKAVLCFTGEVCDDEEDFDEEDDEEEEDGDSDLDNSKTKQNENCKQQ